MHRGMKKNLKLKKKKSFKVMSYKHVIHVMQ